MLRFGFVADGVWKALVGAAMLALLPWLISSADAPGWLLGLTAVAVLASAAAEIAFGIHSGAGSHTKYLVAYDAGWVLASVASVLLITALGATGAWTLWLCYQLAAAPVAAVVFARGARPEPSRRTIRQH
ncbi:hypothetical protein [Microlunatus parietis]|uniref:Uncharacterized protein n=1 Tax=Microlunatus parietis TaxID=682979 RepID=A0A7Y9I9M5_9ACTN|nr:hypothetical protein [Microlunatus parietis]NYE72815.1 hypothetical protein [Microlunatus parietis]